MPDAKKGDLIRIHKVVLAPEQRPDGLPSSTASLPYECWIKGFLIEDTAGIGDTVRIRTFIGREISGELSDVAPTYDHDFGEPQSELLLIGDEAGSRLENFHKTNGE